MKLPNAEQAIVDPPKIRDYCLNPEHPRGKHKARIFKSALGLTKQDAAEFITEIKDRIQEEDCEKGEGDQYGQRYTVDIPIERKSLKAVVRTCWIIKRDEMNPRLTTCYLK